MPEIFEVKLDVADLSHATALFLSLVARPDPDDREERNALHDSLWAWMLHERAASDPDWANQPQLIVPRIALRPEAHIRTDLRPLYRLIRNRLTAGHMAIAFLKGLEHDGEPELPPGAKRLSLNEIANSVLDDLDMADRGNVLHRVWRPSRPVLHFCAAWAVVLRTSDQEARHRVDPIGLLQEREFLASVLGIAELYAPRLALITPPINESELHRIRAG